VSWYRKAAEQGHADAQFTLGYMYSNGCGVPKDDKLAASWYRLAAEQGEAAAQFNLAIMYLSGEGVQEDNVSAHMWLNLAIEGGQVNLAATGGDQDAPKLLDAITEDMTPAQIAEAQRLAREWKSRASLNDAGPAEGPPSKRPSEDDILALLFGAKDERNGKSG
jgi:TPR repeat protein